ncbi:MAG: cadmium-translocating P-type ATPase [Christensenellaceae bacterium]|jgi:Cd2+/Zn2+-exporting ATPase|nr:cadmium-translocating P-type ATPase [Christensenellaceae bacterium]
MKKTLIRLIIGAVIFIVALFIPTDILWVQVIIFLVPFLIIGGDVLFKAARNILHGRIFDENFLMTIAAIGAFVIAEHPEAVAVMLFYQAGELFQSYAVGKSRKAIRSLIEIRPDYANLKNGNDISRVDPNDVKTGDIIVIMPGERVPLDARIIEGSSTLDTSALTGESVPRDVLLGDEILSGCININGVISAEVICSFAESTVSRILDLVENASEKKSKSEAFITKFARIYTPIVVIVAALLAIIPPLVLNQSWTDWIYRALTFLVVSCPCALVVSVPMTFFGGLGGASRSGILIKGSSYLEALAKSEIVVFDKTGTLTRGVFVLKKIVANNTDEKEVLRLSAHAEHYSSHPISLSIKRAYDKEIDNSCLSDVEEFAGYGVKAVVDGKTVHVGNISFIEKFTRVDMKLDTTDTLVYVAVDGEYVGTLVIADEIKQDAKEAISALKKLGIKKAVMLTGDNKKVGERVASELNIDHAYTQLLPADKVEKMESLMQERSPRGMLAFVGDGINDAPALARADIGIAMGGLGADATIEAADVVLMTDEPSMVADAIVLAKRTMRIAGENIIFSIGVKCIVLVLSAFGIANMWMAVFADVGVCVLAVLNAFRALKKIKK